MTSLVAQQQSQEDHWEQRLARERKARVESESIAEKALSDLYKKQAEVDLLRLVASTANQSSTVEEALQMSLDQVCDYVRWPVGHVYFVSEKSKQELISARIWHLKDAARFETFRTITEATMFEPGVGLPGRVWSSRKPIWIPDITKDSNFPRAEFAGDLGIKGAFAFPVLAGSQVVAVLEFFTANFSEPDERLLNLMGDIGSQLGRVFEREKTEKDLQRNLEHLRTLREIDRAITSTLDLPTVLALLWKKIDAIYPDSATTVTLLNKEKGIMEPVAGRNFDNDEWKREEWRGGLRVPKNVARDKSPWKLDSIQIDLRNRDLTFLQRQGWAAYLGVPLISRG